MISQISCLPCASRGGWLTGKRLSLVIVTTGSLAYTAGMADVGNSDAKIVFEHELINYATWVDISQNRTLTMTCDVLV